MRLIPSSAAAIAGAVARARRGDRDVKNIWWPLERARNFVTNRYHLRHRTAMIGVLIVVVVCLT
jgi:hypothetical protein